MEAESGVLYGFGSFSDVGYYIFVLSGLGNSYMYVMSGKIGE